MRKRSIFARLTLGYAAASAGLALVFGLILLVGLGVHHVLPSFGLDPAELRLLPPGVSTAEAADSIPYLLSIGTGGILVLGVSAWVIGAAVFFSYCLGSAILDRKPAADPILSTAEELKNHADRIGTTGPGPAKTI